MAPGHPDSSTQGKDVTQLHSIFLTSDYVKLKKKMRGAVSLSSQSPSMSELAPCTSALLYSLMSLSIYTVLFSGRDWHPN